MYIWQATESQYLTIHLHKHSELLTTNVALLTANVALLTANVVFEPVDSDISAAALIFAEDWHAPFKKFCPACYSVGV